MFIKDSKENSEERAISENTISMDLNSSQLKKGLNSKQTPIEYFIKKPYKNLSNVGLVSHFEV